VSDSHTSSKFLRRILEMQGDLPEDHEPMPSTAERQLTAQASTLLVEWLDGRRVEGFPWSQYGGCRWTDDGEHETLVILFGTRGFLEITGLNLRVLLPYIREVQLTGVRELPSSQRKQLEQMNPENLAIIARIRAYPDFEEVLKEIKGEQDEQPTRHARRA
jgi:hypothetical protein